MFYRAGSITLVLFVVIISFLSHQAICKPIENEVNSNHNSIESKSHQKSVVFYGQHSKSDEIVWLLNQLIDILYEMVSGLELDPTLLQNYHFRQILTHMIKRIDYILEHFENMGELPNQIKSALHRLDCVRIRLSNYIGQKSGHHQDDSVCYESGMMSSTKSPHPSAGGDQNQIMVIITQIVYIIVQIVNRMGPTDNSNKSTMAGEKTTPFDWNQLVNQYSTTMGPLTNTPDWNELISQIMSQMGSTIAGAVSPGDSSTPAPGDPTTVDWGELISAVVAEIEKQYGTTPSGMAQTADPPAVTTPGNGNWNGMVSAWEWNGSNGPIMSNTLPNSMTWNPWADMLATQRPFGQPMGKTTVFDVQSCIDSIMQIVTDITHQLPDTNRGMTPTMRPLDATTQDMAAIMSGILGQFG